MKSVDAFACVYLHRDPIDFRKWIDGLVAVVQAEMKLDPYGSYVFGFVNRRRDKVKMLYWDKTGYALWMKRLEEHRFQWPRKADTKTVMLTTQQLEWLLDGYDIVRMRPHEPLHYVANL
jgi:transposase